MTLISDAYREEQRRLHELPEYGVESLNYGNLVSKIIDQNKITTLLDYGAGKGRLRDVLHPVSTVRVECYDPAVDEFAGEPEPAELVCCIDVLEHIEPECLDEVLAHLASKTERFAFLTVHCGPAKKHLSDGRNAHLIQQPPWWWFPILSRHFMPLEYRWLRVGFVYVGGKLGNYYLQRVANRSGELDEQERPDQSDS